MKSRDAGKQKRGQSPRFTDPAECCICMERPKDHILDPCGHRFCGTCADQLTQKKCPVCKLSFNKKIRIF
jgi:hypothetical protein